MEDEILKSLFARSDTYDLPEFPPNYPPKSTWDKFDNKIINITKFTKPH